MGRMSHRNQERTERRISAAASLMLCALTVLAQIAVTLLPVSYTHLDVYKRQADGRPP